MIFYIIDDKLFFLLFLRVKYLGISMLAGNKISLQEYK